VAQRNVICVATWGDPSTWRYAKYVASDGREVEAFSTLSVLKEVERPAKVVVAVLDTLASYRAVEGALEGGFREIKRSVEGYVKEYLCGVDAEVVVLPGVFERREREGGEGAERRVVYKSDPRREFLPLLLQALLERALEVGATDVVLDVSHGMNFVPTLALEAAEEAAAALAVARAAKSAEAPQVKLRVYQSDPYPALPRGLSEGLARSDEDACTPKQGGVEPPALRYNLILEKAFKPWHFSRYISYEEGAKREGLTDWRGCGDFVEGARLVEEWALPVLGAFRLGALVELALLAKAAPLEELKGIVKRAVDCWEQKRVVKRAGDRALEVVSGARFDLGFWILVHARAALEGVRRLLGLGEGVQELEEAMTTFDELKELKRLVEGSRVVKAVVDRELAKLKEVAEGGAELLRGGWRLYAEVLRDLKKGELGRGDFERDFIAHAGFHSGVVELRLADGGLEARVKSDEWGRVKKVLREVVLQKT